MTAVTARLRAEKINLNLIAALSSRRALNGIYSGDRAAAGAARPAMELIAAKETTTSAPEGRGALEVFDLVPPNVKATRRRLPSVLARMGETDPRRLAADRYAEQVERLDTMRGASTDAVRCDGGPGSSDGGAAARADQSQGLRRVRAALDEFGYALIPGRGPGRAARRSITARAVVDAVCLEGRDLRTILIDYGWSGQRRDTARLKGCLERYLDDMAREMGFLDD